MTNKREYIKALKEEVMKRFVGNEDAVYVAILNLLHKRSTLLIRASRGTGKSTLMLLLLKGLFGDDFTVISGASEVKRGEVIGRLHIPSLEKEGTERVLWARFVQAHGKGIDEVNRLNPYTTANVHHMMQFGEVWAYGQKSMAEDYTLIANENPNDLTTFIQPPPFYDRFDVCVYLNSLTVSQKFELQEKNNNYGNDLVNSMPQVVSYEDLLEIRREVEETNLDPETLGFINVLIRDFQVCIRDKEHSNISPPVLCEGCHFTRFVCSSVKDPPSERATVVLVQLAKARKWLEGEVTSDDIIEMARWALIHRINLVRNENVIEEIDELLQREKERMIERESRRQWFILNELYTSYSPGLYRTAKEIAVEDNVFAEELYALEEKWIKEGKLRKEETLKATLGIK
ncbi:MAG: MoxR family ATPase [Thermoproteota archaeon]|nr:AAA family ATPase [Candidatus Brockarchaeota archaeon]MBO3768542.1 AAA family ATPase [Candidatus Brockarchaeota archaeon]MBO3801566.1 AAA family ATPase [Candidatus Brockarchaeota archaeon]